MSSSLASVVLVVSLGILSGALIPNVVVQGRAPAIDEAKVASLKEGYLVLTEEAAAIAEDVKTALASPEAEYVQDLASDLVKHLAAAIEGSGLNKITAADLKAAVSRSVRLAIQKIQSFLESEEGQKLTAEYLDTEPVQNAIVAFKGAKAIVGSIRTAALTPEGTKFRGRVLTFAKELRSFLGNLLDVASDIAVEEARDLLVEYAGLTPDEVVELRDNTLARARGIVRTIRKFLSSAANANEGNDLQ